MWNAISDAWQDFVSGGFKNDMFPKVELTVKGSDGSFATLTDSYQTTQTSIEISGKLGSSNDTLRFYTFGDGSGKQGDGSVAVTLKNGENKIGVSVWAIPPGEKDYNWVDFKWLTITSGSQTTTTTATGTSTTRQYAHGDVMGSFNSVSIYSNGTIDYNDTHTPKLHAENSVTTALEWECVEFVNRYYLLKNNADLYKLTHATGNEVFNAKDFYQNAAQLKLTPYSNGGSEAPKAGDILVSEGSSGAPLGHVAIVADIDASNVYVAQQNWTNIFPDKAQRMAIPRTGNTVSEFDWDGKKIYLIKGWLRLPTTTTDTTPPVISAVTSGGLAQTTAVITWTTDEDSTSQVEYGTTTAYGSNTALDSTKTKSHSITVTGLTASTTYHYKVRSKDTVGNEGVSTDNTFITTTTTIIPGAITQISIGGPNHVFR